MISKEKVYFFFFFFISVLRQYTRMYSQDRFQWSKDHLKSCQAQVVTSPLRIPLRKNSFKSEFCEGCSRGASSHLLLLLQGTKLSEVILRGFFIACFQCNSEQRTSSPQFLPTNPLSAKFTLTYATWAESSNVT